ncbi:uncharacterized protein LOC141899752 [Tubulanus polymorphus]|uniref:uncharacterized protein LOC141899752 n=1 Tax=Tubulanus polymorphus TaxID=672921 RepID=UPI003DA658A4
MTTYQQPGIYVQSRWTPSQHHQTPQQPVAELPSTQHDIQVGGYYESRREGFAHDHARRCATVQIGCAMAVFLTASILILTKGYLFIAGAGFWGGMLFLIAGSIGIRSSLKKENCQITGTMVFSILSCLAACVGAAFACIAFLQDYRLVVYCWPEKEDHTLPYFCLYKSEVPRLYIFVSLGCHCGNMLFNFIEALVALVQSAICCRAVCCGSGRNRDPVVVYIPYTDAHHEEGSLLHGSGRRDYHADTFAQASAPPLDPPPYTETPEHRLYPALH